MTDGKIPIGLALDPIPHKFGFIPKFIFDLLGITLNRDEVRTPMQWNTSKNAGFTRSDKPWLPVNDDFKNVNAEIEEGSEHSLLITIRELLKVRRQYPALSGGTFELINWEQIPAPILIFKRSSGDNELLVVLNFDKNKFEFNFKQRNWEKVFSLNPEDHERDGIVTIHGYGGMLLKRGVK